MRRSVPLLLLSVVCTSQAAAATIVWEGRTFETVNVKGAIVTLRGEQVLKLERDLQSFPFDPTREVTVLRVSGVQVRRLAQGSARTL